MALLLLLVFNGFLLFYSLVLGVGFVKQPLKPMDLYFLGLISFLGVCALAFFFHSPIGQWFLRLLTGARKAIFREHQQLDPLLEEVQHTLQMRLGLTPLKLRLMVIDDPLPNALSVGKNTLIVTRGLYETAKSDELMGVMAHEFGHLHYGDSNRLGIALGVSTISLVIAWIASLIWGIVRGVSNAFSQGEHGLFFSVMGLVFGLFAWFFLLFVKLGNGVLRLAMLFSGRKQEYRADEFAIQAGYGQGLLQFLDRIKNIRFDTKKSFLARLMATHPNTMLRIDKVERLLCTFHQT